jgi:putative transcriptional regulator
MSTFGKELLQSAKEARAFARGEADDSEYRVHVPEEIDVRALRRRLGMSQAAFAGRFGFNVTAVREWEQMRRRPDRSARVLLTVINHSPELVDAALKSSLSVGRSNETGRIRTGKSLGRAKRNISSRGKTHKIRA